MYFTFIRQLNKEARPVVHAVVHVPAEHWSQMQEQQHLSFALERLRGFKQEMKKQFPEFESPDCRWWVDKAEILTEWPPIMTDDRLDD